MAEAVASASASKDDLYKQLSDEVAKSGMDADRKEHAFKVIGIALAAAALAAASPPPRLAASRRCRCLAAAAAASALAASAAIWVTIADT